MYEIIFLSVLAVVWLVFASVHDLRKRVVFNWLSFSLIIFALGFRFFYSLFSEQDFGFFYQGLIGLGIFFVLGNLFYYGKFFGGGDAKLIIALGPVIAFSESFFTNVVVFATFFMLFLFSGGLYGLSWSVYFYFRDRKKLKPEFKKQFNKIRVASIFVMFLGILIMVFGFFEVLFFYFGATIFVLPYLYVYSKAIDEVSLVKNLDVKKLEEGDWLYRDIKVGKKVIKASWEGLTKKDINEIKKKHKSVMIRQGIPFVPVFLISFLLLICVWFFQVNIFGVVF
ncbi:prepilin peptidase [Candidatus Pacearchaeota archaeon]|nr:prepilin peptidase [Candidatus Pacearchaeota archaeon]